MPQGWFEEGGETRRRTAIALTLTFTIGLMMLAQPVLGATLTSVVSDPKGDMGFGVDPKTGGIMQTWQKDSLVAKANYLDIVSMSLSQKAKTYTFSMEMAAALLNEGSPLPGGFKTVEWGMWIDPSPYNFLTNPVAPLFLISLRYDGSGYSAMIVDYSTMAAKSIPFSIDGASLQLQFTASSIGNLQSFWWSPLTRFWMGPVGTPGYWFVDSVDLPLVDGYAYIDLPWPPA